ncbi:MAG: class I SAM-dependent methyltransferase [Magnetococcales bacterium]|nr:class I SAM-dependent methyltransferase [Magnetococcales bacterium]
MKPVFSPLVVSASQPGERRHAQQLAERCALELVDWEQTADRLVLCVTPERLELLQRERGRGQPVTVDFSASLAQARRQEGLRQTLARAAGLKNGQPRPSILDATPGLGRDAFILAALGCRVTMVERSPVVHALLEDGLRHAREAGLPEAQRLTLALGNAMEWLLSATDQAWEVIYLDPMHPERCKSALVKKELRLLREVVGADTDGDLLLEAALRRAGQRVVVKRPRLGDPLAGSPPNGVVRGESVRYDLYFTRHPASA